MGFANGQLQAGHQRNSMRLTENQLRKVIQRVIQESIFLSQNNNSGPGLAYGDDRYHDLARAYHQQGGTTVGGRELGTVPSDREEMIRAIEHCREWTQSYMEEYDTAPPPGGHSSWPDDYLSQFPDGNITKRHLYFICDSCRMEVIPAYKYSGLLNQIENDGRYK